MTQGAVLTHSEAGVTTITMNRPERLNTLSAEMMEALQAAPAATPLTAATTGLAMPRIRRSVGW